MRGGAGLLASVALLSLVDMTHGAKGPPQVAPGELPPLPKGGGPRGGAVDFINDFGEGMAQFWGFDPPRYEGPHPPMAIPPPGKFDKGLQNRCPKDGCDKFWRDVDALRNAFRTWTTDVTNVPRDYGDVREKYTDCVPPGCVPRKNIDEFEAHRKEMALKELESYMRAKGRDINERKAAVMRHIRQFPDVENRRLWDFLPPIDWDSMWRVKDGSYAPADGWKILFHGRGKVLTKDPTLVREEEVVEEPKPTLVTETVEVTKTVGAKVTQATAKAEEATKAEEVTTAQQVTVTVEATATQSAMKSEETSQSNESDDDEKTSGSSQGSDTIRETESSNVDTNIEIGFIHPASNTTNTTTNEDGLRPGQEKSESLDKDGLSLGDVERIVRIILGGVSQGENSTMANETAVTAEGAKVLPETGTDSSEDAEVLTAPDPVIETTKTTDLAKGLVETNGTRGLPIVHPVGTDEPRIPLKFPLMGSFWRPWNGTARNSTTSGSPQASAWPFPIASIRRPRPTGLLAGPWNMTASNFSSSSLSIDNVKQPEPTRFLGGYNWNMTASNSSLTSLPIDSANQPEPTRFLGEHNSNMTALNVSLTSLTADNTKQLEPTRLLGGHDWNITTSDSSLETGMFSTASNASVGQTSMESVETVYDTAAATSSASTRPLLEKGKAMLFRNDSSSANVTHSDDRSRLMTVSVNGTETAHESLDDSSTLTSSSTPAIIAPQITSLNLEALKTVTVGHTSFVTRTVRVSRTVEEVEPTARSTLQVDSGM